MAVLVKGLHEVVRGFYRVQRATSREIQGALKEVAEPVARTGREKISRYTGASVGTINPRAQGASVYVTQRARKRTGLRGDFGALQQRRLDEALSEHEGQLEGRVEHALDKIVGMF